MRAKIFKVLILSEGQKVSGPTTWKDGIISNVSNPRNRFVEINIKDINIIKGIISLLKCNIVHAYNISGLTLIYLTLAILFKKNIVFTLHGNYLEEIKSKKGIKKIFWISFHDYCLTISKIVTVPSSYLLRIIVSHRPSLSGKLFAIPNGIAICTKCWERKNDNYSLPINLLEITNFNLHDKVEGLIPLLQAINAINDEYKDSFYIQIIGYGKEYISFKSKYESRNIKFLGKINGVDEYIEKCDLFIHSSKLETFGYVILEALRHNKSVISVNVGGIPEILPKSNLVEPSFESIKTILNSIKKNPRSIKYLSKNNRSIIKPFIWSNLNQRWVNVYSKCLI